MGLMIRNNKDISGISGKIRIKLFDYEYKLLQYADDTTILLDGSEKSLKAALTLEDQFSKFSGLKHNYDKTCCVKIGAVKDVHLHFSTRYNIQWSQEPFTFLGITFTENLENILELNYKEKIDIIKRMICTWSRRHLSTIGRITVVKSLLISKITHLLMMLPSQDETVT